MIGAILIGMIAVLVLGQYSGGAHGVCAANLSNRRQEREESYKLKFDMSDMRLDYLRRLDRAFSGTEIGSRVHSVRKERITKLMDERSKRKSLIIEINEQGIDLRSLPTKKLEILAQE